MSANDGTQTAPVATSTKAIALAEKGPGKVYACTETWTEPLVVKADVPPHGGFDCEKGWAYQAAANRRPSGIGGHGGGGVRISDSGHAWKPVNQGSEK